MKRHKQANILSMYTELREQKPDQQIILLCRNGAAGILDLDIVLRQYKFCVSHDIQGSDRDALLSYLRKVVPEGDMQMITPPG